MTGRFFVGSVMLCVQISYYEMYDNCIPNLIKFSHQQRRPTNHKIKIFLPTTMMSSTSSARSILLFPLTTKISRCMPSPAADKRRSHLQRIRKKTRTLAATALIMISISSPSSLLRHVAYSYPMFSFRGTRITSVAVTPTHCIDNDLSSRRRNRNRYRQNWQTSTRRMMLQLLSPPHSTAAFIEGSRRHEFSTATTTTTMNDRFRHKGSNGSFLLYSSASKEEEEATSSPTLEDRTPLVESIRQSYAVDETDGIIHLFSSPRQPTLANTNDGVEAAPLMLLDPDLDIPNSIIPAVIGAVLDRYNKGAVASVMNGIIGSAARLLTSTASSPTSSTTTLLLSPEERSILLDKVDRLVHGFENILEKEHGITPDLLSYALAYTAASSIMDHDDGEEGSDHKIQTAGELASYCLEQAQRKSKKLAGSKRRKILASSRRKSSSTYTESENEIKQLLGLGNDFQVLLETDSFAVINKPSGVPIYHKKTTTAGKIKRQKKNKKGKKSKDDGSDTSSSSSNGQQLDSNDVSLEDALVHCNVELSTLNPDALGIVHRLDRGASGCMVVAKTDDMHAKLVTEFFLRRTTKKYTSLLSTMTMAERDNDSDTNPIIEIDIDDEGDINSLVDNRPAKSKYRVLERYKKDGDSPTAMMVEFKILTGRKHQIRVHAAEVLNCPVWNDSLYGHGPPNSSNDNNNSYDKQKILLHASELSIPLLGIHAKTTDLPAWWDETLSDLEKRD